MSDERSGADVATVAERWAAALAADRLADVVSCYAPGAALRAGGDVVVGADEIGRFWAASPLLGGRPASTDRVSTVTAPDGVVVVRWPTEEPAGGTVESALRVVDGRIVDQSVDDVWRLGPATGTGAAPLVVRTAGAVDDVDRELATDRVRAALRAIGDPVLHATLRLDVARDPAR
jgi:hypothetical protein